MALQDILDKIKNDALSQAEELKSENEKAIMGVKAQTDRAVTSIKEEAKVLASKKYEQEKRLKISLATLEQKNKLLAAKQKLIDAAFEKALEEIRALPDDKYKKLLITTLLKIDAGGGEEVILGSFDFKRFGAALVDEMNAAFSKNGGKGNLKLLSERRDDITGCVLRDGRKETICTFESIIADKRRELEKEIASILFK